MTTTTVREGKQEWWAPGIKSGIWHQAYSKTNGVSLCNSTIKLDMRSKIDRRPNFPIVCRKCPSTSVST